MTQTGSRTESDSFGPISVPAAHYWGAQTQRSLTYFAIGTERMPDEIIAALCRIKRIAADANRAAGVLDPSLAEVIGRAARDIAEGALAQSEFPLSLWQTGSGTQTNMNVNEVIANLANERLGAKRGAKHPVHPNDHVNLSQSSNDTFPTAIHLAASLSIRNRLVPALERLEIALAAKAAAFSSIVKIGRTHLQDATPLTLGQEFSAHAAAVRLGRKRIIEAADGLLALAQGGTAVGTGLNAPAGFAADFAARLAIDTGLAFRPAENSFEALASHGAAAHLHGALAALAADLFKTANDIRLLGSGPRAGLGELRLPENEPGSSIMPGKVNPTQAEAMTMVCAQVTGNQTTITFAASQGHLQLNVMKPVIAHALLQSIRLIADAAGSFAAHCIDGITADEARIGELVNRSLMLVTALAPHVGYDRAAAIAKAAHAGGTTLREAALQAGVTAELFDAVVRAEAMTGPK